MRIQHEITISRPINEVWDVVAHQFDDAQSWIGSVRKSVALSGDGPQGAPVAGRVCQLSDKGETGLLAHEKITAFDAENYRLEFEVTTVNAPGGFPVKKNRAVYQLRRLGPTETSVSFTGNLETTWLGTLLSPVLKIGLTKAFAGINRDLKCHVEGGAGSPAADSQIQPVMAT